MMHSSYSIDLIGQGLFLYRLSAVDWRVFITNCKNEKFVMYVRQHSASL